MPPRLPHQPSPCIPPSPIPMTVSAELPKPVHHWCIAWYVMKLNQISIQRINCSVRKMDLGELRIAPSFLSRLQRNITRASNMRLPVTLHVYDLNPWHLQSITCTILHVLRLGWWWAYALGTWVIFSLTASPVTKEVFACGLGWVQITCHSIKFTHSELSIYKQVVYVHVCASCIRMYDFLYFKLQREQWWFRLDSSMFSIL